MQPRARIQVTVNWPYLRRWAPWIALVAAQVALGCALLASPGAPVWLGRAVLLSAAVLAACSIRAEYGALGFIFLLYTQLTDLEANASAALSESIVALPLLVLFGREVVRGQARVVPDRVMLCISIYAAIVILSAVAAPNPASSVGGALHYLRDLASVLVLVCLLGRGGSLRLAGWTVIAAGTFVAVAGFAGAALHQDLGGLAVIEESQIVGDAIGPRLAGSVGESNWLAEALIPVFALALYSTWIEQRRMLRVAAGAATVILSLAILATFSRGGFIGLLAVLALTAIRQRSWRVIALCGLLLIALLTILAPPLYRDRVGTLAELLPGQSLTDDALRDRESLVRLGLVILMDHPLLGVGAGNYDRAYQQRVAQVDPTLPLDPPMLQHNGPLQIGDEIGLLGLGALAILLVVIRLNMRVCKRLLSSAGARSQALLVEAVEVAVDGYLVTSLFTTNSYTNRYFWTLVVLMIVAQRAAHRVTGAAAPDWSWWRNWPGAIIRSYQRATQ